MTEFLGSALFIAVVYGIIQFVRTLILSVREIEKRKIWRATLDEIRNECPNITREQLEAAAEKEAYRPKGY